jgi:hypothetical protein
MLFVGTLRFSTAPTANTPCRRCGAPIEAGRVCIEAPQLTATGTGKHASSYLHPACAVDLDAEAAVALFALDPLLFDGREPLESLARARVERKGIVNRRAKSKKTAAPEELAPIEPARDPFGRPRVRVPFVGSGFSVFSTGFDDPTAIGTVLRDATVLSSKREFVFIRHSSNKSLEVDPSQPWAACLYWQSFGNGVAWANYVKVADWCALGLPPPVLVVIGPGVEDAGKRDEVIEKVRKLATKAGFDGDDCPVVHAATGDAAFLEALALALDEQADRVSGELSADRTARTIEQLEALVRERREDGLSVIAKKCLRLLSRARVAERERILAALLEAIERGLARTALLEAVFSARINLPAEWVVRVAAAQLRSSSTRLVRFFELFSYWRPDLHEREALPSVLIDAIIREKPSSERAKACAMMLPSIATPASIERLAKLRETSARQRARAALIDRVIADYEKFYRRK